MPRIRASMGHRLISRGNRTLEKSSVVKDLRPPNRAVLRCRPGPHSPPIQCTCKSLPQRHFLVASGVARESTKGPLALSPRFEAGIPRQLARDDPREQARLDFQNTPVADTIPEHWMRDERVHPLLVGAETGRHLVLSEESENVSGGPGRVRVLGPSDVFFSP